MDASKMNITNIIIITAWSVKNERLNVMKAMGLLSILNKPINKVIKGFKTPTIKIRKTKGWKLTPAIWPPGIKAPNPENNIKINKGPINRIKNALP